MREKLIDLLYESIQVDKEKKEAWIFGGKAGEQPNVFHNMADYLIANGVATPVRCKDCKHHEHYDALLYCGHIRGLAGSVSPDGYCSYGERRNDEALQ